MKCPNCQAKWDLEPSTKDIEVCPFCLEPIETGTKRKQEQSVKESFYYTWGLVHEETLKKQKGKPDPMVFEMALENYLKALDEKPEYAEKIAGFLMRYPLSSTMLSKIKTNNKIMPAIQEKMQCDLRQEAVVSLLMNAYESGSVQAAMKMVNFLLCANKEENQSSSLKQNEIVQTITPIFMQEETFQKPEALYLQSKLLSYQEGQKKMAFELLEKGIGIKKHEKLFLLSPELIEQYTEIKGDKENRLEHLKEALEQKDLKAVLQDLYRPLYNRENKFDHLSEGLEMALDSLLENKNAWYKQTLEWIEREEMLSGIHLVLQMVINQKPELKDELQKILDKHFEKVYMQPYSMAEKSDYQFSSKDFS